MEKILFSSKSHITFMFTGQGCCFPKMGLGLYNSEPIFKEWIDKIDEILKSKYYGFSMFEKINSIDENDKNGLNNQHLSHSALFMFEVSLCKLLNYYGLHPNLIIGISLGEIASAFCSGMIDLETACYLTYKRAFSIEKTINGDSTLIIVAISENEFSKNYSLKYPTLEIASELTSSSLLLGGKKDDFIPFCQELKENNIFFAQTSLPTSFHTSSMEPIKNDIIQLTINNQSPKITHLSSVNCKFFNIYDNPFNSTYLYNNIRNQVSLAPTVKAMCKYFDQMNYYDYYHHKNIVVEISPHNALFQHVQRTIDSIQNFQSKQNTYFFAPLSKGKNEVINLRKMILKINSLN
ncbi:hypothetical protein ACTA71_004607 [Dictyostelium dimigraforme]